MIQTLENLRGEISSIDEKILKLLSQRMHVSEKIAAYKKANNIPVFDPKREEDLLLAYQNKVDFEVADIYRAIMDESKRIQKI